MTNEQRIDLYKQAAALIMTKSYAVHEMQMLANVTNYLAQEIQAHEVTAEASSDHGPESEAPVL